MDADTTDSLPSSLTIATGLDALTHAIEASTANNSSVLTRAIAIGAAQGILESLPVAVQSDIDMN